MWIQSPSASRPHCLGVGRHQSHGKGSADRRDSQVGPQSVSMTHRHVHVPVTHPSPTCDSPASHPHSPFPPLSFTCQPLPLYCYYCKIAKDRGWHVRLPIPKSSPLTTDSPTSHPTLIPFHHSLTHLPPYTHPPTPHSPLPPHTHSILRVLLRSPLRASIPCSKVSTSSTLSRVMQS